MKKTIIILLITAFPALLISQTISRDVKATGGEYNESSGMALTSTIGEPLTGTLSNGGMDLTQGFQQPTIVVITSTKELSKQPLSVSVYPNPAQQYINLDISSDNQISVSWHVYNSTGQKQSGIGGELTVDDKQSQRINFSGLSTGQYYIRMISDKGEKLKTIKVQKVK